MSKYSFEDFKSKIDPMWTAKDPNKIVEVYYFENIYHTLPQRTKKREGVVGRTPEEVYLKALHLWSPVIDIKNHTIKSDDTVMIDDKKKLTTFEKRFKVFQDERKKENEKCQHSSESSDSETSKECLEDMYDELKLKLLKDKSLQVGGR